MTFVRSVAESDWILDDSLGDRRACLLHGLDPRALLDAVGRDSERAAGDDKIALSWQESCECPSHCRAVARIPLTKCIFDQLMNGRAGYRAQYYLSPEEGVLFNRDLLERLCSSIDIAYKRGPLVEATLKSVLQTIRSPHAKIWIHDEQAAFDAAQENTLNPRRWVENGATRGRRAPLPSHATIDVKGAFLDSTSQHLFVDDLKLDRPMDLFNKGYT